MAHDVGHLISLNGEYLYLSADNGAMYAPLRITEKSTKKIQQAIVATKTTPNNSCIKTISAGWCNGKFVLATEFNETTKCTVALSTPPSHKTKTEICFKKLCNGKCTDNFMQTIVAKNILPELYNTKQK